MEVAVATGRTFDYAVFGGVLRSEMEFPELPPSDVGRPDWTFEVRQGAPPFPAAFALGERQIGAEKYSLWRTPSGLRLEYSHAGWYDVSSDGTRITWYRGAGARPELVRWVLLGSAMALALEARGCLCLHGSAVSFFREGGESAVAFLAPKHHGKSTLAAALTIAGGRLVGDDTLAVVPGAPCLLRPGVASLRLREDASRELQVHALGATVLEGVKTTFTGFDPARVPSGPIPLDAVYILAPFLGGGPAARRSRLPPGAGAVAMAQRTKLADALIGYQAAGAKLKTAARIAATVPVYALLVARDFGRLPAVVEQLMEWHGPGAAASGS
jgi:hypothetical protein